LTPGFCLGFQPGGKYRKRERQEKGTGVGTLKKETLAGRQMTGKNFQENRRVIKPTLFTFPAPVPLHIRWVAKKQGSDQNLPLPRLYLPSDRFAHRNNQNLAIIY
jgi:protocatechuate 3,4-dioxygenase beta subunit